jgi:hypothetical protein
MEFDDEHDVTIPVFQFYNISIPDVSEKLTYLNYFECYFSKMGKIKMANMNT